MTFFHAFAASSALYLTLFTAAVLAGDTVPPAEPSWITFAETPLQSNEDQVYHVRATKNADPKLLKIVSTFVGRSTDLRMLLVSYSDANMTFRTNKFMAERITGKEVTFAAASEFPESVMRSLAKRFRAMGFRVEIVAPEALLRRSDPLNLTLPTFVIPGSNGPSSQ